VKRAKHIKVPKLPARKKDTHKGDYGHVLVIAGSRGMTGAACLTAESACRAGAGLVTAAVPESLNPILEVKLTEVMTAPVAETAGGSFAVRAIDEIMTLVGRANVCALGPGISRNRETDTLVAQLLRELKMPVVLDADGINALDGRKDVLEDREANTIITPHPGEFVRLAGISKEKLLKSSDARKAATAALAKETGCIVLLKGHRTCVSDGERIYVNTTGNPGMATGGSGDVLTGVVAGLWAQELFGAFETAVCAAYIHGLAGDLAAEKCGEVSLTAIDILDALPAAFLNFSKKRK